MAPPRIFISSTFYDLQQVRENLEQFIREIGYEPVLYERGSIPYGSDEELEKYCYEEIERSDMLLAIIGGRYGSSSQYRPYSISQMELKTAVNLGRQIYVFVHKPVLSEYSTYLKNKDKEGVQYHFADDVKVYRFLEEVKALPQNNPIAPFETAQDIIDFLKAQWAGLFQRFLQRQSRSKEIRLVQSMEATANTLDQLVAFLTEERRSQDRAIQDILLSNHPAFQKLRSLTGTPYRVFFTNHDELTAWLRARSYSAVSEEQWDDPKYEEWIKNNDLLKILTDIFDEDGKLKVYTGEEWSEDWITKEHYLESVQEEELPF